MEMDDTPRDDPLVERHGNEGHDAIYSAGHREPGTVVIICSRCSVRSRITIIETAVRILYISWWVPGQPYSRWMQYPACQTRSWCKVDWLG